MFRIKMQRVEAGKGYIAQILLTELILPLETLATCSITTRDSWQLVATQYWILALL